MFKIMMFEEEGDSLLSFVGLEWREVGRLAGRVSVEGVAAAWRVTTAAADSWRRESEGEPMRHEEEAKVE